MLVMGRLCLALMFMGSAIGLLAAALFDGLSGPGVGEFYAVSSFSGGGLSASESARYVAVAVMGAVVGAAMGAVLHLAGVRVQARRRVGFTTVAGLVGCTVGVLPAVVAAGTVVDLPEGVSPLVLYAVSGAAAYGLAIAAVYLALRVIGDPATTATVQATAIVLPVGAVAATATGVGSAWALGFSTVTSTWIVVIVAVLLVLSATFAVARAIGVGRDRS
jgi:hypothetical protein